MKYAYLFCVEMFGGHGRYSTGGPSPLLSLVSWETCSVALFCSTLSCAFPAVRSLAGRMAGVVPNENAATPRVDFTPRRRFSTTPARVGAAARRGCTTGTSSSSSKVTDPDGTIVRYNSALGISGQGGGGRVRVRQGQPAHIHRNGGVILHRMKRHETAYEPLY